MTWRRLGEQENLMTPGVIQDVSPNGLALCLDAPVRAASILVVQLDEPPASLVQPFLVRVKYVRRREEGGWQAGGSFARKLEDAQYHDLVGATAATTEPPRLSNGKRELRTDRREKTENCLTVRIKPVNLLRPAAVGRLRNRSKGGLGLFSLAAFPAGTILDVRVEASDAAPWLQLRVKHCRPYERQWILGCQFTEPPEPMALAQFDS
jgi:hypothetical protein